MKLVLVTVAHASEPGVAIGVKVNTSVRKLCLEEISLLRKYMRAARARAPVAAWCGSPQKWVDLVV